MTVSVVFPPMPRAPSCGSLDELTIPVIDEAIFALRLIMDGYRFAAYVTENKEQLAPGTDDLAHPVIPKSGANFDRAVKYDATKGKPGLWAFKASANGAAYVVIPGTDDALDGGYVAAAPLPWLYLMGGARRLMPAGFVAAWRSLAAFMAVAINDRLGPVTIVGHSLGAAMAQMAVLSLGNRGQIARAITFASPGIIFAGPSALPPGVDVLNFRIADDIVPRLPVGSTSIGRSWIVREPTPGWRDHGTIQYMSSLVAIRTARFNQDAALAAAAARGPGPLPPSLS